MIILKRIEAEKSTIERLLKQESVVYNVPHSKVLDFQMGAGHSNVENVQIWNGKFSKL